MVPINSRQRLARSFERFTDGRFLRRRNATVHGGEVPLSASEYDSSDEGSHDDANEALIARRPSPNTAAPEYEVEQIWAMRRLNATLLYLVQWVGHRELAWEPRVNLPWQMVADFEQEHHDSVWNLQITGGRARPAQAQRRRRRGARHSARQAAIRAREAEQRRLESAAA